MSMSFHVDHRLQERHARFFAEGDHLNAKTVWDPLQLGLMPPERHMAGLGFVYL